MEIPTMFKDEADVKEKCIEMAQKIKQELYMFAVVSKVLKATLDKNSANYDFFVKLSDFFDKNLCV